MRTWNKLFWILLRIILSGFTLENISLIFNTLIIGERESIMKGNSVV